MEKAGKGSLFNRADNGAITCLACANRCSMLEKKSGICKARHNINGELMAPYGYVSAMNIDPIEKKPFYHVRPGSATMSFGMLGCNFHCVFCQNWHISQLIKEGRWEGEINELSPGDIIEITKGKNIDIIVSTYNEPLISPEWAGDIFELARKTGMLTGFVSNGHATREAIDFIAPKLDMMNIDLKTFSTEKYKKYCGGRLSAVLDTIKLLREKGIWVELVTLVIPGFNDSKEEIRDMADFISSVDRGIPWHFTAFHPDYKMLDRGRTPMKTLDMAFETGREAGLYFVYTGNRSGAHSDSENTICPGCKKTLIFRDGYDVVKNEMSGANCPECGAVIPGIFTA